MLPAWLLVNGAELRSTVHLRGVLYEFLYVKNIVGTGHGSLFGHSGR